VTTWLTGFSVKTARACRVALDMHLSASDFAELDYAFPAPNHKQPLAVH
jgi:hypothetical protein